MYSVLPSVCSKNVGTSEYLLLAQQGIYFAAQYPACTFPVNASTPSSRTAPHDSGPLWFAIPSTYETFTHTTLPVLPAHWNKIELWQAA